MSLHESRSPASPGGEAASFPNAELIASALRILGVIPKYFH